MKTFFLILFFAFTSLSFSNKLAATPDTLFVSRDFLVKFDTSDNSFHFKDFVTDFEFMSKKDENTFTWDRRWKKGINFGEIKEFVKINSSEYIFGIETWGEVQDGTMSVRKAFFLYNRAEKAIINVALEDLNNGQFWEFPFFDKLKFKEKISVKKGEVYLKIKYTCVPFGKKHKINTGIKIYKLSYLNRHEGKRLYFFYRIYFKEKIGFCLTCSDYEYLKYVCKLKK